MLESNRAFPVSAKLEDVDVDPEQQEILDQFAGGPRVPVLRKAVDQKQRLAKQGLMKRLWRGAISGDHQRPTVRRLHQVLRFLVQRLKGHLVHRRHLGGGHGKELPISNGHGGTLGAAAGSRHFEMGVFDPIRGIQGAGASPGRAKTRSRTAPTRNSEPVQTTRSSGRAFAFAAWSAPATVSYAVVRGHRLRASARYFSGG